MVDAIRCKTLKEAVTECHRLAATGDFDLFRGQAHQWPLLPTAFRRAASEDVHYSLDHFRSWAGVTCREYDLARDDDIISAIAQHYGVTTTLLDFTTSIEIAAYFACEYDDVDDGDAIIFCGRRRDILRLEGCRLIEASIANLWRLEQQKGLFVEVSSSDAARHLEDSLVRVSFSRSQIYEMPRSIVYPERKSALEVKIDEFRFQTDMARGETAFAEQAGATIDRFLYQTYPGVFHRRMVPAIDPAWSLFREPQWNQIGHEAVSSSLQSTTVKIIVPRPLRGQALVSAIEKQASSALLTARLFKRFVAFKLQAPDLPDDFIKLLCSYINKYWDAIRITPIEDELAVRSLCTALAMAISEGRAVETGEGDESPLNDFLREHLWLRYLPPGGRMADGAVSISTLRKAIDDRLISRLNPYYKKLLHGKPEDLLKLVVEPYLSFKPREYVDLFFRELTPSAFARIVADDYGSEVEMEYLALCFAPHRIGAMVNATYGMFSPYAGDKDIHRLVLLRTDMTKDDVFKEAEDVIFAFLRDGNPFRCKWFGFDFERTAFDFWETDAGKKLAEWALAGGLAMPLDVEDLDGVHPFHLWLAGTGQLASVRNGSQEDYEKTAHYFAEVCLPEANKLAMRRFTASGGTLHDVKPEWREAMREMLED